MFLVNGILTAKYIQSNSYGTSRGNLKVYIPELMSEIPMSAPKKTPISLNKACYSNAKDCTPSISSKIDTQNFVTAQESYHGYRGSYYRYGSELKVQTKDEDCLKCVLVSEDSDNSFDIN